MGKIDDVVGYLADFSSDLFSGPQVQLDSFARVGLKDAQHSRIRLERGFSCAGKLEQATAAIMIPSRNE